MVFALQKYRHYLLANPFIFYTDHQALKYLINIFLYKMGLDDILRRCILQHERNNIIYEAHYGPVGGHFQPKLKTKTLKPILLNFIL